jgi:RNA polymerase sigma-70 factor (ECF subfamily)
VALSEIDRSLLERCLARKPRAWEEFVDRFIGLVWHVIQHSARCRSIKLTEEDREDLCATVFLELVKDDFAVLRHFRRHSSLATYLTVIARRVVVRELLHRKPLARLSDAAAATSFRHGDDVAQLADPRPAPDPEERLSNTEEVQRLLAQLQGVEADVVRLYHLEGKSYQEISQQVGVAENSVGPMLSRAREKIRAAAAQRASAAD